MDHPEICGKQEFNDARTRTKDAIHRKHTYGTLAIVTDLTIPNKKCNRSQQLQFNPHTFPTLTCTCGPLSKNILFERVFLLLPTFNTHV